MTEVSFGQAVLTVEKLEKKLNGNTASKNHYDGDIARKRTKLTSKRLDNNLSPKKHLENKIANIVNEQSLVDTSNDPTLKKIITDFQNEVAGITIQKPKASNIAKKLLGNKLLILMGGYNKAGESYYLAEKRYISQNNLKH